MKKFTLFAFAVSLALPVGAQAQQRYSAPQLIEYLTGKGVCEDRIVASASYVNETDLSDNRVRFSCEDAEGFVPVVAAAGLGFGGAGAAAAIVGVAAAAAAAGGGGSTPDTQ